MDKDLSDDRVVIGGARWGDNTIPEITGNELERHAKWNYKFYSIMDLNVSDP